MSLATRLVVGLLSAVFSVLIGIQSLSRFGSFHNRTFDLALYARQAWGLAHASYWDSIIGSHFLGTHVAVVLWPLGWLGRFFGTVPVLLVAQALAFGLATLPLAQFAARRFGDAGALAATVAYLLYPNVSHVASYEFHPGSLGVLPLSLAINAIDRQLRPTYLISCASLLACRADFAVLTCLLGVVALLDRGPEAKRLHASALIVVAVSLGYLALQFLWLRPTYWALKSSLDLHFAPWGGGPTGIVKALFREPQLVREHLFASKRLAYLPSVLLPLAFLPLFAPRWLLLSAPFLAINLISVFPTTVELYSHYLTPAVPPLIAAALEGLARLSARYTKPRLAVPGLCAVLGLSLFASVQSGGLPWSRGFDHGAFTVDAYSAQAARVVAAIPAGASVQAPDPLLPHLAERTGLFRAPPPDKNSDYVVLDVTHRARYLRSEDLLRTLEEPVVRHWLARRDYGLVLQESTFMVFARDQDPRTGIARRFLPGDVPALSGIFLTRCLSVLSAWLDPQGLALELLAHAPCPPDLALRIGTETTPRRVDLLFDGVLSAAQLRDEVALSWHPLDARERARILERGLRLGALRANGGTPEAGDPSSVPIPLIH